MTTDATQDSSKNAVEMIPCLLQRNENGTLPTERPLVTWQQETTKNKVGEIETYLVVHAYLPVGIPKESFSCARSFFFDTIAGKDIPEFTISTTLNIDDMPDVPNDIWSFYITYGYPLPTDEERVSVVIKGTKKNNPDVKRRKTVSIVQHVGS